MFIANYPSVTVRTFARSTQIASSWSLSMYREGFTIDPVNGVRAEASDGRYAVAVKGSEMRLDTENLTGLSPLIRKYLETLWAREAQRIMDEPYSNHEGLSTSGGVEWIGGWFNPDDKAWTFHLALLFHTEEVARVFAERNEQASFFDLRERRVIWVEPKEPQTVPV